ncbi:hypothetical protein [Paraburkholderia sp. J67]|uniref:hypothetical protein n=1 Tax=Paraburkholderia sp. J67 TaxID=2805435 RepID=UPI002ABDA77F|nr:hypothetical protein [Paraburkholderia sp. J67]
MKKVSEGMGVVASRRLDVVVTRIQLMDRPARMKISLSVGLQNFFSDITWHSIDSWSEVISPLGKSRFRELIGAIVAWDAMRFMALGGECLTIADCEILSVSDSVRDIWRHCFMRQFAEWRYRNHVVYPDPLGPNLLGARFYSNESDFESPQEYSHNAPEPRCLLTNGGGKDTLASMMILSGLHMDFDLYEGYMPLGGNAELQADLLGQLSTPDDGAQRKRCRVTVSDNFFDCPDSQFINNGVICQHYKGDFMVGHTANYVGYFPLIIAHRYNRILFNIEKSADSPQVHWNGEPINHQWCKSDEYRRVSTDLFRRLTSLDYFLGFDSPLSGLYDLAIYRIIAHRPDLLLRTHSCNYKKPWCRRCTKCLFCYLMMSALFGEDHAMSVVGASASLFPDSTLRSTWLELLSDDKIAWECVPGPEECQLAASLCLRAGIRYPILEQYALADEDVERAWRRYGEFDETVTPGFAKEAIRSMLADISIGVF